MKPEHILVVDDEEFALKTVSFILRSMGFEHIETVDNAMDALSVIAARGDSIDLVLTDLNMPGMNGIDLIRAFEEQGFQGRLVLLSGEDQQTLEMSERLARGRNLTVLGALKKPLQRDQLTAMLHADVNQGETPSNSPSPAQTLSQHRLRDAIATHKIVPWYQPKVRVSDRKIVGVEVLARWPQSSNGAVYPDMFIPAAEEYGLIDELTFSLLEQVIRDKQLWEAQDQRFKVALNVSMMSLQSLQFSDRLEAMIERHHERYEDFMLEVTESQLMQDLVTPLDVLVRLRMKRLSLSIDDFGTGHSNLAQLRDLPFDELKLDKSFVQSARVDKRAKVILESSLSIAKNLSMTTVAEGVESAEEWALVEQMGCEQVQGYFIARPMPFKELISWCQRWQSDHKTADSSETAVDTRRVPEVQSISDFDRITRLVAHMFGAPLCCIVLTDEQPDWLLSSYGEELLHDDVEISFCWRVARAGQPVVVKGLESGEYHAVLEKDGFAAGVPLWQGEGEVHGALCIFDREVRDLSDEQLSLLQDFAVLAEQAFLLYHSSGVMSGPMQR
ncbi:EAL domain-containing protein [Pontibacterium granulatum]|uniref:EAL domain-containing protein n=1 Tax=Pontibacterium granulatum TaxID=2036029 RepID=UPI002499BC00|nr:EAL domain-containing protein [Pontibacterium granulatum]MDI3323142.1 EAL domain-containing protein [Pontibacterium granulatum]